MNRNITLAWGIINGIIALAVCYQLIFVEETSKSFWLLPAIFFVSIALQQWYKKRQAEKR